MENENRATRLDYTSNTDDPQTTSKYTENQADSQGFLVKIQQEVDTLSIDDFDYGFLKLRRVNDLCDEEASKPVPRGLFIIPWSTGNEVPSTTFWYEGECCCLFADSNAGKSILAVQIANEIAKHQMVVYFDFELSGKQFQMRYSDEYTHTRTYRFPGDFFRVEINPDKIDPSDFEVSIINKIEQIVSDTRARIIIIDNITYLCSATEKGDLAGPLMVKIMALRKKYDLSILVLAHTPKRDMTRPISQNDLAGSKKLFNLFRSAFAIGASVKGEDIRYIKQIKCTNGEIRNGKDSVVVCSIEKGIDNFLMFNYLGTSPEAEHLRSYTVVDEASLKAEVMKMHSEGMSVRKIGAELHLDKSKVSRIIKKLNDHGDCLTGDMRQERQSETLFKEDSNDGE